jgi:hypothetical protein
MEAYTALEADQAVGFNSSIINREASNNASSSVPRTTFEAHASAVAAETGQAIGFNSPIVNWGAIDNASCSASRTTFEALV